MSLLGRPRLQQATPNAPVSAVGPLRVRFKTTRRGVILSLRERDEPPIGRRATWHGTRSDVLSAQRGRVHGYGVTLDDGTVVGHFELFDEALLDGMKRRRGPVAVARVAGLPDRGGRSGRSRAVWGDSRGTDLRGLGGWEDVFKGRRRRCRRANRWRLQRTRSVRERSATAGHTHN